MNIQELQQKLFTAPWDNGTKAVVAKWLPKCGPRMLTWLQQMAARTTYAREDQEDVRAVLFAIIDSINDLTRDGYWQTLDSYLTRSLSNGRYGYGKYLLPFVLDLKDRSGRGGMAISPDLQKEISEFEIDMFEFLPLDEVEGLLQFRATVLAKQMDIFDGMRKLRARDPFGYEPTWAKPFSAALQASSEVIGDKQILVDGKLRQPTVGNWIQDFIVTVKKPTDNRSAIDAIEYLEKSPNTKNLADAPEQQLLQILKLFAWLTNPVSGYEDPDSVLFPEEHAKESSSIPVTPPVQAAIIRPASLRASVPKQAFVPTTRRQAVKPSAPASVPSAPPIARPKPSLQKQTAVPKPAPVQVKPPIRVPIPSDFGHKSSVNIQDLLNKAKEYRLQDQGMRGVANTKNQTDDIASGVSLSQQNGFSKDLEKIRQEVESKRVETQTDIDKKLEALKKRKQN